jgi:hypothetical protein
MALIDDVTTLPTGRESRQCNRRGDVQHGQGVRSHCLRVCRRVRKWALGEQAAGNERPSRTT